MLFSLYQKKFHLKLNQTVMKYKPFLYIMLLIFLTSCTDNSNHNSKTLISVVEYSHYRILISYLVDWQNIQSLNQKLSREEKSDRIDRSKEAIEALIKCLPEEKEKLLLKSLKNDETVNFIEKLSYLEFKEIPNIQKIWADKNGRGGVLDKNDWPNIHLFSDRILETSITSEDIDVFNLDNHSIKSIYISSMNSLNSKWNDVNLNSEEFLNFRNTRKEVILKGSIYLENNLKKNLKNWDWLRLLCLFLSLIALVIAILRKFKTRRKELPIEEDLVDLKKNVEQYQKKEAFEQRIEKSKNFELSNELIDENKSTLEELVKGQKLFYVGGVKKIGKSDQYYFDNRRFPEPTEYSLFKFEIVNIEAGKAKFTLTDDKKILRELISKGQIKDKPSREVCSNPSFLQIDNIGYKKIGTAFFNKGKNRWDVQDKIEIIS